MRAYPYTTRPHTYTRRHTHTLSQAHTNKHTNTHAQTHTQTQTHTFARAYFPLCLRTKEGMLMKVNARPRFEDTVAKHTVAETRVNKKSCSETYYWRCGGRLNFCRPKDHNYACQLSLNE